MEEQSTSHKGQRLHSYDFSFKIKVINYVKEHGNHKASKVYAVDRKRVREWRKSEESLKEVASRTSVTRKRRSGAGRKINFPHIEEHLIQWLKARRESGVRVTGKSLKQEAIRQHTKASRKPELQSQLLLAAKIHETPPDFIQTSNSCRTKI